MIESLTDSRCDSMVSSGWTASSSFTTKNLRSNDCRAHALVVYAEHCFHRCISMLMSPKGRKALLRRSRLSAVFFTSLFEVHDGIIYAWNLSTLLKK